LRKPDVACGDSRGGGFCGERLDEWIGTDNRYVTRLREVEGWFRPGSAEGELGALELGERRGIRVDRAS